jgi:thiamine kinase-like enzyme
LGAGRSILRFPRVVRAQVLAGGSRRCLAQPAPQPAEPAHSAQPVAKGRGPEAHVDAHNVVGASGTHIDVRPLEDVPERFQQFSDFTNADIVRDICAKNVPGWNQFPKDRILIDQLCEGLSNQNFKVHLDLQEDELLKYTPCVLFRIYGTGAEKLYDPELEVKIVMMLAKYGIGPTIYSYDTSWRIEGWHYSVPLLNRSMKNPSIWSQMAAHMGRLHKLAARPDFPHDIRSLPPLSTTRLHTWSKTSKETYDKFQDPELRARMSSEVLDEMLAEREWLESFLVEDDPQIEGSGLSLVFSHWDTQENNVLQTLYGLRFIDFEYAGMDYQAFDIASYFVECSIDYLVTRYPFYKITLSDFPTEEEMRTFLSVYLSEYLEARVLPNDLACQVLMERVQRFTLASHLLWSLWSVIRAGQAPTYGDFDYLHYANSRFFQYKWAKRALLHKLKVPTH